MRVGRTSEVRRPILVGALVLGLAVASGCGTTKESVDHPEGTVALVQNQPTRIGDLSVVASNVKSASAAISVVDQTSDEMAQGGQVAIGDTATIGPLTFDVVDIVLAQDRAGEPGSDTSTVWILPE